MIKVYKTFVKCTGTSLPPQHPFISLTSPRQFSALDLPGQKTATSFNLYYPGLNRPMCRGTAW